MEKVSLTTAYTSSPTSIMLPMTIVSAISPSLALVVIRLLYSLSISTDKE